MTQMEWGENRPQLVEGDYQDLPQFKEIVSGAFSVVANQISPLKSIKHLLPPVIVCSNNSFNSEVKESMSQSTREINKEGHLTAYAVHNHCVFFSLDDVAQALSSGDHGRRLLTMACAHEYIHALTTDVTNKGITCGFVSYQAKRYEHGLIPGAFYYYDMPQSAEGTPKAKEDPLEIRLTENATDVAVDLMLDKVLPNLAPDYPLIIFGTKDRSKNGFLRRNHRALSVVLRALVSHKKRLMEEITVGTSDLLTLLSSPNLNFFVTTGVDSKDPLFDILDVGHIAGFSE